MLAVHVLHDGVEREVVLRSKGGEDRVRLEAFTKKGVALAPTKKFAMTSSKKKVGTSTGCTTCKSKPSQPKKEKKKHARLHQQSAPRRR